MTPRDDLDDFARYVDPLTTRGWKQTGGQLQVAPTPPTVNAQLPYAYELLGMFESLVAQPIEWQVNLQYTPPEPNYQTGFPPRQQQFGLMAGARELFGSGAGLLWGDPVYGQVAAKIELGGGPNARVIYTDLRPGRYALGGQTFARVSVARWGTADTTNGALQIQSSIVPSLGDVNGEPPTFTFAGEILAAGFDGGPSPRTATFAVPPGAHWFDMQVIEEDAFVVARFNTGYGFTVNNDIGGPSQFPACTPWNVPTGASEVTVENYGDTAHVRLTFWVR